MIVLKLHKVIHVLILLFLLVSCQTDKITRISGKTMGTSYHITVISKNPINESEMKSKVDSILVKFNLEMSTWIPESSISKFNQSNSTDAIQIPNDFYTVMKAAHEISELSNGAFDVTVSPLIDLWGFGRAKQPEIEVSQKKLDSVAAFIGYKKIEILPDNKIRKTDPRVSINLSAIAKGYAVDKLASFVKTNYSADFLIEIGGEIVSSGLNQDRNKWQVGILKPDPDEIINATIQSRLELSNQAMATSGDYMNFYEIDGKRYSHTIDPTTLKPISHQMASVTVIARNCMYADAVATAIDVMGVELALDWIKKNPQFDVYMIERENKNFKEFYSDNFKRLLP